MKETGRNILRRIVNTLRTVTGKTLCSIGLHRMFLVMSPEHMKWYRKKENVFFVPSIAKHSICIRCQRRFRYYWNRDFRKYERVEEFPWEKNIPYYIRYGLGEKRK